MYPMDPNGTNFLRLRLPPEIYRFREQISLFNPGADPRFFVGGAPIRSGSGTDLRQESFLGENVSPNERIGSDGGSAYRRRPLI